jgi:GDP-L-fucose synthase
VNAFFAEERPDVVVLAAAKVGGIKANNDQPVEFLLENLRLQNNVISASHANDVRKLLFLGSSCIYPKHAAQPITESALLTGALEPTNDAYAIAKIAGIRLCQAYSTEYGENYISAMPTNLYGPHDNFDLLSSHVLPRSCGRRTRRRRTACASSSSGEAAIRGANSCTSTIWRTRVFSCSRIMTRRRS